MGELRLIGEGFTTPERPPRALFFGSRNGWRQDELKALVQARIDLLPAGTIVIEGGAPGADRMAGSLAAKAGFWVADLSVRTDHFSRWRKGAFHRRNVVMASLLDPEHDWAEGFYAGSFPARSSGSADMEGILGSAGLLCLAHWADGSHSENFDQLPTGPGAA